MTAEEALITQLEPWIHEDGPRQKAQYAQLAEKLFPTAYVDLRARVKLAEMIGAVFSDEEVLGLVDAIGDHWTMQLEKLRASVTTWAPGAWREPAQPGESGPTGPRPINPSDTFAPRAVQQLDASTGAVIAEFCSVAGAAAATGQHASNISYACRGKRKTSGGFAWRYAGSRADGSIDRRRRPIRQLDPRTGAVLAEFLSIAKAAAAVGCKSDTIADACRGKRKTSGGFAWRYAEDGSPVVLPTDRRCRAVQQLDPNTGAVLAEFRSVAEAAAVVGRSPSALNEVFRGRQKTAGGFAWRYAAPQPEESGPAEALSADSFVLHRGPAAVRLLDPYNGTVLAEFSTLAEAEVAAAGHMRVEATPPVLADAVILSTREAIEARAEIHEDFLEEIRREREEAEKLLRRGGCAGVFGNVIEEIRREQDKAIEVMARASRDLEAAAAAHNLTQLREIVELGGGDLASYTGRTGV